MRRAARGLDTPAGTVGLEIAAEKLFDEFLASTGMKTKYLDNMHTSVRTLGSFPTQNFYSLLTAFTIFLQTKKSNRARVEDYLLAKATALGYFSQVLNMLRERYQSSIADSARVAKIREKMGSAIEERKLRAGVQTNDAPGCTIDDLCVLVASLVVRADVATGLKSVHDAALLAMMWHTFGRAIDTCFARKQQLSVAASGEMFLHIARIKTSVVQDVSIYKAPERWQQCMFHAFGLLFVCYDEPSEYLFPLVPPYAAPDLPGGQTYTQEEAIMYWESLQHDDSEAQPAAKRERKRPNVASYITEVIRDTIQGMPPTNGQAVTPNMTSHSLRRGSAAYANASPKLATQWISTRGDWLLESLTKAFAYIGTTTRQDQSVGKVLAGYEAPDLPVVTPSIGDLRERLSVVEFGQLVTLRGELFRHVRGFPDARFNVADAVVDATFAALLMHLETVLEATQRSVTNPAHIARYVYELERGIAATNARMGSSVSISKCCEWGKHLNARWCTANHAQVSSAVTGGDSLLASTMQNILNQLVAINDRLGRLEDAHDRLLVSTRGGSPAVVSGRSEGPPAPPQPVTPSPATATTLAGCVLNWYTSHIWETVKGKREQNQRAEAKAAINILLVLYQAPCEIPVEPQRSDAQAYQRWKNALWELAGALDAAANVRLRGFDQKKVTLKASSLRKRWRLLRKLHPDAYRALGSEYLRLKSERQIVDGCTPQSHQWTAEDVA